MLWIRDPVPFSPLGPGSGIGFFRISDSGFQTHIFERLIKFFISISLFAVWTAYFGWLLLSIDPGFPRAVTTPCLRRESSPCGRTTGWYRYLFVKSSVSMFSTWTNFGTELIGFADPHHFNTDPDPSPLQSDATSRASRLLSWASMALRESILSLESFWILTLVRFRIHLFTPVWILIRIQLFTLMWIRIRFQLPKIMLTRIRNLDGTMLF